VVGCILNIERLFTLPYQTYEAFRKANFNQLYRVGREAISGFKNKSLRVVVGQVNGAGVNAHGLLNAFSQTKQCIGQPGDLVDLLNDTLKYR
jgi:serine phosphatase RsbU (regulator of sigma subunit)